MLTKKLIPVLALIASLMLSACFTPWEGEGATLSIYLDGGPSRAAAWGEHINFMSDLEHRLRLEGPGGVINHTLKPGELNAEFRLAPGNWTLTIEGYLFGIRYSAFSQALNLRSGTNSVSMPMAHSPPEGGIFGNTVFTTPMFPLTDGTVRISGLSPGGLAEVGSILNFPIILDGRLVTQIGLNPSPTSTEAINLLTNFNNSDVTHVSIPGSVTTITSYAFYGSTAAPSKITSLTLGHGLVHIGNYAFAGNNAANAPKITSLVLPDSVVTIGASAFDRTSLDELVLSESLETIGAYAFRGDHTFTSLTIPDSVKTIGTNAFNASNQNTARLETLIIGNGLTFIAIDAFSNQRNLKNLTIGNNVNEIGNNAFLNHGLTSVVIPANVLTIQADAFSQGINNHTLRKITFMGSLNIDASLVDRNHVLEEVVFYTPGVTFASGNLLGSETDGLIAAYTQGGAGGAGVSGVYRRVDGTWQRVGDAP